MRRSFALLSVFVLVIMTGLVKNVSAVNSVSSVNVAVQKVQLTASAGVAQIRYFTLDSPKRLVVDLYGVQPGSHAQSFNLDNGFRSLRVGPYEDKTRFVFDVAGEAFPTFSVNTENEQVVVAWQNSTEIYKQAADEVATVGSAQIKAIDFSSEAGSSRFDILVDGVSEISGPDKEGNKIQFSLNKATIPRSLRRPFDTLAFPSAIHSVNPYVVNIGGVPQVRFAVLLKGDVDYQLKKTSTGYAFIVNDGDYAKSQSATYGVLPVAVKDGAVYEEDFQKKDSGKIAPSALRSSLTEIVAERDVAVKNTEDKTSLTFDNIDVRDVLRLFAEEKDINLIVSDDVKGSVTLRLVDVPWDQAFRLVLDTTGLDVLQEGNVIRVLPKDKVRSLREAELTSVRSEEKLEPVETEVITVSYADLGSVTGPAKGSLSERGSITEDSRNKLLIVTDIPSRIQKVRELIDILDTPERQVMIEARIVEVNSDYSRDLGINWGVSHNNNPGGDPSSEANVSMGGQFLIGPALGFAGLGAGFTFGEVGVDSTILDLRISALEASSNLKVISTPRVTTLNGKEATIKQGTEIPYQTVEDGEVKTEFKEVVLELKVTPVINPDGSVIMTIAAKNDSPIPRGEGALSKKSAETMVLVKDGETTVLGGVFIERDGSGESGVPFLGRIPILGHLFKSTNVAKSKDELLIFVTPRILKNY